MKKFAVALLVLIVFVAVSCSENKNPAASSRSSYEMQFRQGANPSNGYTGASDAQINDGAGSADNYGGCNGMGAGVLSSSNAKSVLKFDITNIPATAFVTGAYLTFKAALSSGSGVTLNAYALNTAWDEGNGCGSVITGKVSWDVPWTAPGGDYDPEAIGETPVYVNSAKAYTIHLDAAVVQGWLSNSLLNYGIILAPEGVAAGGCAINSKEDAESDRPLLIVYYTLESKSY